MWLLPQGQLLLLLLLLRRSWSCWCIVSLRFSLLACTVMFASTSTCILLLLLLLFLLLLFLFLLLRLRLHCGGIVLLLLLLLLLHGQASQPSLHYVQHPGLSRFKWPLPLFLKRCPFNKVLRPQLGTLERHTMRRAHAPQGRTNQNKSERCG
jgi:hypothetical protein